MIKASHIRCTGPMPMFSGTAAPSRGNPPQWLVFPATRDGMPFGERVYRKGDWLQALLLMRRLARDRRMPFASYVQTPDGGYRKWPPPLYP